MINTYSNPTDLKITDMRFVDIDGAPKRCTILKIMTNQGITGYGEVRDASSKTYALMLKSRILGENPCNVDRIFRKIKQFGGPSRQGGSVTADMVKAQKSYSIVTTAHPFTGIHLTEKGLDYLENYVKEVREVIGYEVPLAIDHFGHVCVEDCIRFAKRMEPYKLAWLEDMVPWMYTDQYVRLKNSTTIPIATGEDIYLKEGFETLIKAGGVSVIHPDILTCGGALELKKIADIADENGVAVAVHMAESPVACLAAVHTAAAMHNVLALEFHSVDVPWWADMVTGINNPIFENGFIKVPEKPGIGFDELNEEVIKEHINPQIPGYFEPTDEWNKEFSNDRIWS